MLIYILINEIIADSPAKTVIYVKFLKFTKQINIIWYDLLTKSQMSNDLAYESI